LAKKEKKILSKIKIEKICKNPLMGKYVEVIGKLLPGM